MSAVYAATVLSSLLLSPQSGDAWRSAELAVADRVPVAKFEELRELALQYLGRPYVMGGVGSPGFDCSGFTCRVYAEAGYAIPRVSRDQAEAGREVAIDAIAAGDLVFFSEDSGGKGRIAHVGMYLGDGDILHASTSQGEIVVANFNARWFQDHLVSARRFLPEDGLASTATAAARRAARAPVRELVEHSGDYALPLMLRRPVRKIRPSYGPELAGGGTTAVGVRSAAITENGTWGVTIAPEASLFVRSVALELALVLPIRFEPDRPVSIGEVNAARDLARYLRTASLGLRGADLELRFSQLGDLTLLSGLVLDKLAPGSRATGVPGMSLGRAPLSFFGGFRSDSFELQSLVDDVVDPAIAGAAFSTPLLGEVLEVSAAFATDQQAVYGGARRAVNALEAELGVDLVQSPGWSVELGVGGAMIRALDDLGSLGLARASFEHRFDRSRTSAISLSLRAGYLGRGTLVGLFGPTYLAEKDAHLTALAAGGSRPILGAEAHFQLGRVVLGALYEDALGDQRRTLDRRLDALLAVQGVPLGGSTRLDLRVAYASRGAWRVGPTEHALHGGLGLRLTSWLLFEVYAEKGERVEGGAGISIRFEP